MPKQKGHCFSISFTGFVIENPQTIESIHEIHDIIRQSFPVDLQAGVELHGMTITADEILRIAPDPEPPK